MHKDTNKNRNNIIFTIKNPLHFLPKPKSGKTNIDFTALLLFKTQNKFMKKNEPVQYKF